MSDITERLRGQLVMSMFANSAALHAEQVRQRKEAADEIDRLRAELAEAKDYARSLAVVLHRDHYADVPQFEPFDDLMGLLSQIDNMITGWKPEYGGQPSPDSIVAELKKFNAWRKGEIHEWNVGMHSGPDPREISALIDRAVSMLAEAKAQRVPDDVDLWPFLRDVLRRGAAIESQFSQQGYETFISEIEHAARGEHKKLRAMLAASQKEEGP